MGLFLRFFDCPYPRCRGADVADNGLAALGDVDVLNDHALFALRAVIFERLDLRREGPGELVEGAFSTVLRREVVDVGEAARESHSRVVNGGHLGGEQRLDLIARLDSL